MSEVKVNKISPRTNCGTTQLGDAGDTITVTGDLKSNSLKSASGSTITLGQSGDTIQLGCGASQTGFGRTGTVDWDTTAKTASFTAVSGNGYFVNTTSGAITLTLPASPSAGDIVSFKDYAYTFATNNLSVAPNGSNIGGADNTNIVYDVNGASKTFIYVDATQGWLVTNESTDTSSAQSFITATGGTITTCGDFKIHTFTGPGTFCVSTLASTPSANTVDYLVAAGGGGGGGTCCTSAGAGGAGGFRYYANTTTNPQSGNPAAPINNFPAGTSITVTATAFPITVGAGGAGGPDVPSGPTLGTNGANSTFSTITSAGGGGGHGYKGGQPLVGNTGGSGGGGSYTGAGGSGNTPPTSPAQGFDGGNGDNSPQRGGGGGGALAQGADANSTTIGDGGVGAGVTGFGSGNGQCSSCVQYFSGGGGGASDPPAPAGGSGGLGGGGAGGKASSGTNGSDNTGGGGGGGQSSPPTPRPGGTGGSGIVIIRYKYQ
jgi:hypothetical protein